MRRMFIIIVFFVVIITFVISTTVAYATDYEYDDLDRLIKVDYDDGETVIYTYDSAGNIINIQKSKNFDINDDGIIDMLDIVMVAQNYNTTITDYDLNDDGRVNLFDLILIAKQIA